MFFMPTYLQSMGQLHDSYNLLVCKVFVELINVDLLTAPWMNSAFMYLEKRGFDFPRYKKIDIIQENILCNLAVVILLLEQHKPLVLIRGLRKIGSPYVGTLPENSFSYKTLL